MGNRHPPGPDDRLLGLRLALRLRRDPLEFAVEIARRYGDVASFRLGPYRAYVLNHPSCVREVLVTQAGSFCKLPSVMRVLRPVDGDGLVIREGESWLHQRRNLQPAFAVSCLDCYAESTVALTRQMIDQWSDTEEADVAEVMSRLMLAILTRALFDIELSADQADNVCRAVTALSEILIGEMGQPFRLPDWLPLPWKRRKGQAVRVLDPRSRDCQPMATCW